MRPMFRKIPSVFPGFHKPNIRPSLDSEIQIYFTRCDVNQSIIVIQRQIIMCFALELLEFLVVVRLDPASRRDIDRLKLALNLVSSLRRCATTSNCNGPTAPRIRSLLRIGLNNWVAPSSQSCASPFLKALSFNGSFNIARWNISGAKLGMPEKRKSSPCVKLSPIFIVP